MENDKLSLLTDEPEENVQYIKPNVETKLSVQKRQECREIVQEIKKFGINQRQLLYLIQLLALELENTAIMRELQKVIGENREKIPISNIVTS